MNARGAFLLFVAAAGALFAQAADKKPVAVSASLASRWTQIEAETGLMNLDGTLRRRFSLGESRELKLLGLQAEFEHRLETDAFGRARSVWRVRGLQTFLALVGREHLLWQPPGGIPVKFERARIGRALSEAGSARWRIRESAPDVFELRSLDGLAWHYAHGRLVSATHPALGELRFTTQGAWITAIRHADGAPGAPPLLAAGYDENGRLISCALGGQKPHGFVVDESGQLQTWRRADGTDVRFAYRDGLLSEIVEPGHAVQRFTWKENPGHERGDSRWAAP
ncbi:MAG: hypothetical protein ACREF9_08930, partial [Opitutaceae bacterium]